MSDEPTEIVFSALQKMQANGARSRAALDATERLRATAAAVPQPAHGAPADDAPHRQPPQRERPRIPLPDFAEPPRTQPTPSLSTANTGDKAALLAALRGPVLACAKCPNLAATRTQVVFGTGNPDAELMFVGEAPGADEDTVGEPFVGRAGQLLTKIIEAMNFRRADVYIANILKCRPDMPPGASGNRKPTPTEMNVCKPYLLRQIEIIQPKVIVALGGTAVEGLLGMDNAGIMRMRGTWKEFQGIPLMPTFHPAYLLHNQSNTEKRKVWEDMMAVLEKLGREITAKQRGYFLGK